MRRRAYSCGLDGALDVIGGDGNRQHDQAIDGLLIAGCGARSRSPIKGVVLRPGDRLFNEGKVIVKYSLGSRTGIDRGSASHRRHDHLCGHECAGHIGGILGRGHSLLPLHCSATVSNSLIFPQATINLRTQHPARASLAILGRGRACSVARDDMDRRARP